MSQKTAVYEYHEASGAKLIEFAGFTMPVRYTSDKEEHLAVRNAAGIFDVSHMGEFWVEGEGAFDLLQWVVSNDIAKLTDGKVLYGYLPNEKGGVVDDLLVYRFNEQKYLLVVNAANIEKDWQWINAQNRFGAQLTNVSADYSLFAIQGPKAMDCLQPLTDVQLSDMPYYTFQEGSIAGINNVIISATGYTGAGGVEVYVSNDKALSLWNKLMEAGKAHGLQAIGLGARDTLRLEMGYCLYGNDLSDTASPLEAGLGWVTKFKKNFLGKDVLQKHKEEGLTKKLVGFKMIDKGIPRAHYSLVDQNGDKVGEVTSGSLSPSLNIGIGLALIDIAFLENESNELFVEVRNRKLKAEIHKTPFVEKGV